MRSGSFHIVSSIGDPNDPKTWSGTPKALVDAFRQRIPDIQTHDITFRPSVPAFYQIANALSGLGYRQAYRVGLMRRRQTHLCEDLLPSLGEGTFLHFGSTHLPVSAIQPGQRHFYFTDNTVDLLLNHSPFGKKVTAKYRRLAVDNEKDLLAQVDGVCTSSWYVRDSLIHSGYPANKIIAVGTGLGRVKGLEGETKDYRSGHLLFVAKLGFHIKGGHLLLDALDIAIKSRPDLRLVLIGNNNDPDSKDVLSRIKDHPNIDFYNWDTPEFKRLVRSSALYTGPALSEPWGLIYLEAMVCETPVLGLNRNALPQFTDNGRCGFLVDEATPGAVADAILDAMSDPERLQRMAIAGRDYVLGTFSWEIVVDAMIRFMEV